VNSRHLIVFVALILCAATAFAAAPDPAVRIELSSRRDKVHPTRGTVTITAIVKNVGTAPYVSRAGQQSVQLYEMAPGTTSGGTLKVNCDFPTLNVGQEVRCPFTRPWDIAIEFQPSYKAMIVYDPDILLDSNPKNDDASSKNNTATVSWTAINALGSELRL
jgi:hypothetical protein